MNDHAGWGNDGRCVICLSKDPSKPCLDPYSDEFKANIINLERELQKAKDDANWWQKKHQEDCLTMRYIGRREGAREMQSQIRNLIWSFQHDEYLDSEIAGLEYKEDHLPNCNWWKDWHDCSCGAFDKKE